MSVLTRTWRHSALYTVTATLAGAIAGLKAAVDAEVAANPTTAKWQVADSSVPNGTLTLKRTANGTGGRGRIMVFGGSAPNTNAIDAHTSNTSFLYGGYAPDASVDAPEQAYATGKPYTTGDWVPGGGITSSFTGLDRLEYYETEDGMFIVWRAAIMNAATSTIASFFAGDLAVSVDGQTAYAISGGSAGTWTTAEDTQATGTTGMWLSLGTESTASSTRTNYVETVGNVRRVRKIQIVPATLIQDALRDAASKRYFIPIYLRNSDQLRTLIKLRQIGAGISEVHNQAINSATLTPAAIKIALRSDTQETGPWLLNVLT